MATKKQENAGENVTFERFVSWIYVTGLIQLGLLHENGDHQYLDKDGDQQYLNVIAAGTSVEMLKILKDKCKGNLSAKEEWFLQRAIDDLGAAYGIFAREVNGLSETVEALLSTSQVVVDHVEELISAGQEKLGK